MGKSYKTHSFLDGLRFSCVNAIKTNKIKILISFALVLIAISTGIFIAIKNSHSCNLGQLKEICLVDFASGFAASSSAFFSRCFSLLVNIAILLVLTLSPHLFFLAEILFVYRGYLFGLNFALIFIFYGLGGVVTGIVVVLPCQLLILFAMIMFYIVFQRINQNRKKFGCYECNRLLFVIGFVVLLLLVNLAETLLLCLLNGRVIMVI